MKLDLRVAAEPFTLAPADLCAVIAYVPPARKILMP